MRPGDTFLLHDLAQSAALWVVITPANVNGEIAIVSLGPAEASSDERNIVGPRDHPDVLEDCTVRFRFARYVPQSGLRTAQQQGALEPMTPCTRELLRRIQRQALASDFTEQGIQRAIKLLLER